ncbi:MAG TPA: barstar family protein [Candidatus Scatavimonas merdigallinarum]|uniref:Barstar family protein n=1 Tax=Candidatus Scatavimonas merdigallinarum TaxID=2840914 RepID=A0A9D1CUX0_9FIRM|nr:barstar family protein [Candidatus Scatavimonas merdigallinarum]
MKKEKIVTLDLTGCKYLGEIHQRIKKAFDFPDFYGENWSAFDDLLWSECDANKVVVLGEKAVSEELKPSIEMINEILQELKEHRKKYGEQIEIEIHS